MTILVLDTSNMLYRTFYGNQKDALDADFALHMAFMTMNKFYKKFKPDTTILAFDSKVNWRKGYTKSEECLSQKPYKGTRRKDQTPAEERKYKQFIQHVNEFQNIMREHTKVVCMGEEGLEADDIIGGIVEAYGEDADETGYGENIYIVSRDRDLAQLQGRGKNTFYPNVKQYDPFTDQLITIESAVKNILKIKDKKPLDDKYVNHEYLMLCKCIRGDTGDNVQSAFPGVRRTRINKAWEDDFQMVNLLEHTWKDGIKDKEFRVRDLIKEGKLLMDLRGQPDNIRNKIFKTILHEMDNPGEFNYFKFLKFLGDYNLPRISKSAEDFIPLLNG